MKTKAGLFVILLLNVQFLIAQSDTSVHVSVGLGIDRVKERQEKMNVFADNINNYKGGILPEFLFDECFDLQSNLWDDLHSPVSLRWRVLEKATNRQALKSILDMHDKRLKQKCNYDKGSHPEIIIPMIKRSFYRLIRKRYKQLK
jgi:hypothetical protein